MKDLVPPEGALTIDSDQGSDYLDIADKEVSADAQESVDAQEQAESQEPMLTEQQAAVLMQTLHEEQNLMMGGLIGLFAAMIGAGIWAGVTIATEYQIALDGRRDRIPGRLWRAPRRQGNFARIRCNQCGAFTAWLCRRQPADIHLVHRIR